jgi:hypothetical protein
LFPVDRGLWIRTRGQSDRLQVRALSHQEFAQPQEVHDLEKCRKNECGKNVGKSVEKNFIFRNMFNPTTAAFTTTTPAFFLNRRKYSWLLVVL